MKNDREVVKYDNSFNLTSLNELDKIEQDIFMSICSEFTKLQNAKISIDLTHLKEKAKLTDRKYSDQKYLKYLSSTVEKLAKIVFIVNSQYAFTAIPLFSSVSRPNDGTQLNVELNQNFIHYLYDIPEKIAFSMFELEMFLNLNSKYSKTLFRFLLQNFTGKWEIKASELKKILSVPKSYTATNLKNALNKATEEINQTSLITDLTYEFKYSTRRGHPVDSVLFTYKINREKRLEMEGQSTFDFTGKESVTSINQQPEEVKAEEIISDSRDALYDPPIVIEKPKAKPVVDGEVLFSVQQTQPTACPKCGAAVVERTAKNGKRYHCCENSNRWGTGNKSCSWFEWVEEA